MYIPLFVPSSPMIIFIDFIICIATGGDMKDAYVALWDFPRIWFIRPSTKQLFYHMLVEGKELNNLKTKTDLRGTLGCCDKIEIFKNVNIGASENSKQQ